MKVVPLFPESEDEKTVDYMKENWGKLKIHSFLIKFNKTGVPFPFCKMWSLPATSCKVWPWNIFKVLVLGPPQQATAEAEVKVKIKSILMEKT